MELLESDRNHEERQQNHFIDVEEDPIDQQPQPTPPTDDKIKEDPDASPEELSEDDPSDEEEKSPKPSIASENDEDEEDDDDDEDLTNPNPNPNPKKKQKSLSSLAPAEPQSTLPPPLAEPDSTLVKAAKKAAAKKKSNNVWVSKSTRKGKKKSKPGSHSGGNGGAAEDAVLITPIPRFPDRSDDTAEAKICLSKVYKAEKVEISEDRLSAGSSKGYRMVRATRGVVEGAWYFEIRVSKLGESGHTRLGWSTEKGDLQAPVGYDGNSFGYRDVDGSKVHKAVREKYGEESYVEGDVIGFYINLPEGAQYAPKQPHFGWYKGQRYMYAADGKEEPPKVVPGSEISFFKNGVCQGVAFKDLFGGRYYPAASMYTLPNQPNCVVTFNFGPDFEFFPQDFDGRPIPSPMIEAPYHGFDGKVENGESNDKKH